MARKGSRVSAVLFTGAVLVVWIMLARVPAWPVLRGLLTIAGLINIPAGLATLASVAWSRSRGTPMDRISLKSRFVVSLYCSCGALLVLRLAPWLR
jgi:hypothetical protein